MSPFRVYSVAIYYGTLLLFGVTALALHGFGLLVAWLPQTPGMERFFRRAIQRHFRAVVAWVNFARVCRIEYRGFDRPLQGGMVVAANHPGLMDATVLIARVSEAVCIFKGSIRRNPVFGAARCAGYLANDGGLGLVRAAREKIAAGATLVIFPEGTRTPPGEVLGTLKPGFAAIARQAGAPIQLVRITCDSNLFGKGRAWWKPPRLPACILVEAGPRLDSKAASSTAMLVDAAEAWFREAWRTAPRGRIDALEFRPRVHTLTAS